MVSTHKGQVSHNSESTAELASPQDLSHQFKQVCHRTKFLFMRLNFLTKMVVHTKVLVNGNWLQRLITGTCPLMCVDPKLHVTSLVLWI